MKVEPWKKRGLGSSGLSAGILAFVVAVLMLAASAVLVSAHTQLSPYPYGDATKDGSVDVADYARVKGIILGSMIKSCYSDATQDGDTDVADYARVKGVILGSMVPDDMYRGEYDYNTSGAGTADRHEPCRPGKEPAVDRAFQLEDARHYPAAVK